jgi:hypothetical protein
MMDQLNTFYQQGESFDNSEISAPIITSLNSKRKKNK